MITDFRSFSRTCFASLIVIGSIAATGSDLSDANAGQLNNKRYSTPTINSSKRYRSVSRSGVQLGNFKSRQHRHRHRLRKFRDYNVVIIGDEAYNNLIKPVPPEPCPRSHNCGYRLNEDGSGPRIITLDAGPEDGLPEYDGLRGPRIITID